MTVLLELAASLERYADLQDELAKAKARGDMHRNNWVSLFIILRDVITCIDDAAIQGYITVPPYPVDRWQRPVDFARNALESCPRLTTAIDEHTEQARIRAELAETAAAVARREADSLREQLEKEREIWFSIARRAARRARQKERDRCVAIAQDLDCEEPPDEYLISDPELDPYMPGWEKAQCYHGDRIAAVILGQEDVRAEP